ncbi:hypothetical protein [Legionella yabuuchiae]|uniref:hypothetical protein n=1 Tax=Legionella yabuuchiae TaxID=376727 RepID=UPI0010563BEB|nr:hypothetical protein [Legionella yabuuchiae]
MYTIFKKQKKPSRTKNTFQNYYDHINCLLEDLTETMNDIENDLSQGDVNTALSKISQEVLKRLTMLEPIYDRYDYFDEIVGATAVSLLGISISLTSLALAFWESIQLLAINAGIKQKDGENHSNKAIQCLLFSGAMLLVGVCFFLKSSVSLLSRPLMTLIEGWKEDDKARFTREDSFESWVQARYNAFKGMLKPEYS